MKGKCAVFFKDGFTERLKKEMIEKGMTYRQLADELDYSYEGVRQIILGNGSSMGIYSVCGKLGIDIKELMK